MTESSSRNEATPTVTLSAQTTNGAGKNIISHGPLTIDLTDLEGKLSTKMHERSAVAKELIAMKEKTFEDVLDDDNGKFATLLIKIKGAYEEFVESMIDEKHTGD